MDLFQTLALAIVQGLTEFLPISSSAHLILPSQLLGWPDQGLAFDVAVHVGSLTAVMWYFRADVIRLLSAWWLSLRSKKASPDSQLAWAIIIATIPVCIVGVLADNLIEAYLRSSAVIAFTTIFWGLVLAWADRRDKQGSADKAIDYRIALYIGLAQVLALIPGTSRSGITMTAALFLGLGRKTAANFSFLMSIPVILLAGASQTLKLATSGHPVDWQDLLIGAACSGVMAYLCIYLFLEFIERIGFMPFVVYRLLLGTVLVAILW